MSDNVTNLSQALVSSMEILARSGDQSLSFDKTIEGTIVKAVEPATGEYKVRYLNGTISAYDISLEMKYKAGDEVYVQVPQNDMSLKKLITGKKSTKSSDLVEVVLDSERVDKIGLPLEIIYNFSIENGTVGSTQGNRYFAKTLYKKNGTDLLDADKLFQNYATNQSMLLIEAEFKTSWFESGIAKGNYGLELTFELKDSAEEYTVILDRQSMNGNSLLYNDWTPVSGLLSIEGDKLNALKSVKLFSESFQRVEYDEPELQSKYQNGEYEIFVKNISINFVREAKTLGYTASINTPDGAYFTAIKDEKPALRLQALLKHNGQVLKDVRANYHWFRRNSKVNTLSDKFEDLAGVGWERVEGSSADQVITLDIFGRNSISQLYKVIIIYEGYVCEDEVILYRTTDSDDYELHLTKDANNVGKLRLKKVDSDEEINFGIEVNYEWSCVNNNGLTTTYSTNSSDGKTYVSRDGLVLNNIYLESIIGFNTYYCNVFTDNDIPIVTVYKTVQNIQVPRNFDVVFAVDGDGFYSYNTKGDYISDNLNKRIDFDINWRDEPTSFYYQWVPTTDVEMDKNNQPFLTYKNKMFEGTSEVLDGEVDPDLENSSTQSPFYFTIRNRYQPEKAENNVIQLNIIIDGITYTFRKNLTFLKEGSTGTNGTSLMLKVEPAEDSDIALQPAKGSSIVLKCTLYYNGQTTYGSDSVASCFDVEGSVPYDFWGAVEGESGLYLNPFIEDVEEKDSEGKTVFVPREQISITRINTNDTNHIYLQITTLKDLAFNLNAFGVDGAHFNSIIQLKFTPNKDIFNYNLYKLYGVPLAQISKNTNVAKYFVTGTKEVLYDTHGYNPQYAETEYKIYADKTVTNQAQFVTFGVYADSVGFNLQNRILVPWTYYDYKKQRGAVYFSFNNDDFYCQPIIFASNLFSEKLLNAWDGASLQIDDKNSTVLAAQVGAGVKDDDNKFTGVLMGQYTSSVKAIAGGVLSQTGLLGFHKGESTFGLLDSGDAYFGSSGLGRIEFLTSTGRALIQSSGYVSSQSSGIQETYFYRNSSGATSYNGIAASKLWTEIPTSNMVITFEPNDTTNRGRNLNDVYYTVGGPSEDEGPNKSATFIKIKLKEVDVNTQTITAYYQDVNDNGEKLYKKSVTNQVERVVKELTDGGWKSTRTITTEPQGEDKQVTEEDYLANKDNSQPVSDSENYQYFLYIYDAVNNFNKPYEYVKMKFKKGEKISEETKEAPADEIYTAEAFKVETTTARGQGMQINLTSGQIDAADFKLQSRTILINSSGTSTDYAIKVGSDSNAFYIRHDGTGMIGGWTIAQVNGVWSLYAGNTYLSSAGEIVGARLQGGTISGTTISGSSLYADYIRAYNGVIGGWTIERGGLSSGNAYLYSNGSLQMGSGSFMTTIDGTGVQIGETMWIDSGGMEITAGDDLKFLVNQYGVRLTDGDKDTDKIFMGWSRNTDTGNIHPFLQLGAGSGSDTTTYHFKKEVSYLWVGDLSQDTGIEIKNDNTIVFKGTSVSGNIYAILA